MGRPTEGARRFLEQEARAGAFGKKKIAFSSEEAAADADAGGAASSQRTIAHSENFPYGNVVEAGVGLPLRDPVRDGSRADGPGGDHSAAAGAAVGSGLFFS